MNFPEFRYSCGKTRRQFLTQMGNGFFGTALTYLLAKDGVLTSRACASETFPGLTSRLAPPRFRIAHLPAKAKSCIFLYMVGGPSHIDTFDPKPELAKFNGKNHAFGGSAATSQKTSGKLKAAPWAFPKCGQSGIEVSEIFQHLGQQIDNIAVLRGMHADSAAHGSASLQMNTGYIRQGFPALGSWANYGLGSANENMPGFVVLVNGAPYSGAQNWGAGFMPAAFQGTVFNTSGEPILNLKPASDITVQGQRRQLDLLTKFDTDYRAAEPANSELAARLSSYELAFRMQANAPQIVDLASETDETRHLYGMSEPITEKFGRSCLLARRLVERGVRFVELFHSNWDTHGENDARHKRLCTETDKPIAGLLADLKRRGLLDETLVAWAGEFGRTPIGTDGRDHHAGAFSVWMAGGGIKGGAVHGETDDFGFSVVHNKTHVHDLHATILYLMGLDHERLTYRFSGRDFRLTDVAGKVITPILT